jgi:hypothetical protein
MSDGEQSHERLHPTRCTARSLAIWISLVVTFLLAFIFVINPPAVLP